MFPNWCSMRMLKGQARRYWSALIVWRATIRVRMRYVNKAGRGGFWMQNMKEGGIGGFWVKDMKEGGTGCFSDDDSKRTINS